MDKRTLKVNFMARRWLHIEALIKPTKTKFSVNFYFLAILVLIISLRESHVLMIGLLSAVFHEMGHVIAITQSHHKISEVRVGFFCIDMVDSKRNLITYKDDIFILLAGSMMNLCVGVMSLIAYLIAKIYYLKLFFYTNLLLCFANLLPISTLDGGQILYIILNKKLSLEKSEFICEIVSFVFLLPLSALGFLVLLKSRYNFSLLYVCYILVSVLLIKTQK